MSPYQVLNDSGLMGWASVYMGYGRGWLTETDLRRFAAGQVANGNRNPEVIAMAAGRSVGRDEAMCSIFRQIDDPEQIASTEDWRYAFLVCIRDSALGPDEKLRQARALYIRFDCPADMAVCVSEERDTLLRLLALDRTIDDLKREVLAPVSSRH